MHKDASCGDTLFFLEVSKIAPQLIDVCDVGLSLFAFNDNGLIVAVEQDHIGARAVLKREFTYLERRMNSKAVFKVVRISEPVSEIRTAG